MKTIFENEFIRVESTGKDYDFIATIENKTDKNIRLRYNPMDFDVIYDTIDIEPNDWVGLLTDKGDIICGCCGGIIPADEIGGENDDTKIIKVYDFWVNLDETICGDDLYNEDLLKNIQ